MTSPATGRKVIHPENLLVLVRRIATSHPRSRVDRRLVALDASKDEFAS
jgi:hypothetical protein